MTPAYREIYWRSQDDLRLYARIYESKLHDARTVLCLHGLMRNSRDFEDLAPHLQPRYRVVVPDLRGAAPRLGTLISRITNRRCI